ncbi:shikimate dehydrogenase [Methylorubrum suomiense]|uniref:Shikimate dehydrogenase (NADP(+)) n=1 Tax=Methylorubrum suomiense TaxID=144191 RepID=A0ABQ4URE5_9HYPH|nr:MULTISPECIES: shikimate dehydrogenase [Methylobacteriaceae]GJE73944.1 Shikimate dehydrogenase (NADP(+)) [Methylorubrum suomiense]
MTRKAFVIGHPIAHSRSPMIHGHWLAEHGIDGTYERIDVPPEALEAFIRSLPRSGFAGGNVTIPHKETAFRLVDSLTERAERVGAVNTLVVEGDRVVGDNTDGLGFIAHLDHSLGVDWPERAGHRAVVLGAGGAARGIVAGLLGRGMRVQIANRSPDNARSLAALDPEKAQALPWDALPEALPETGLLINATSLGMVGHPPLDLDLAALPARAAVADIVYVPLETPLLAAARARGLAAVDGLGMLLHQAVPGFAAWFGVRPEVTPALREMIVADLVGK